MLDDKNLITKDELSQSLKNEIFGNGDCYIPDITVEGRTLTNLLGRAGNAIYRNTPDVIWECNLEYDKDKYKVINDTNEDRYGALNFRISEGIVKAGKYYIMVCNAFNSAEKYLRILPVAGVVVSSSKYKEFGDGEATNNREVVVFNAFKVDEITGHFALDCGITIPANGYGYFRNIRFYEISKEEYDNINMFETNIVDKIDKLYPYVDDVKCVVNPYFESNENLLGNTRIIRRHSYSLPKDNNFGLVIPSDNSRASISNSKKLQNGKYTLSFENFNVENLEVRFSLCNIEAQEYIDIAGEWGGNPKDIFTFEVKDNFNILNIAFRKTDNVEITDEEFNNIESIKMVLVKGDIPKTYEECHNSRIMFETKLYEGEKITRKNDGVYVKNSLFDEVELRDSNIENLRIINGIGGYKSIIADKVKYNTNTVLDENFKEEDIRVIAYNGSLVKANNDRDDLQGFLKSYNFHFGGGGVGAPNCLYLTVPNTLTGWGDSYTPTPEEIKAFFLGWRMTYQGSKGESYNGTGTKQWHKLWCGIGDKNSNYPLINNSQTQILPTVMNDQGYTPYRLIYKKETPTTEEVKTYGGLVVKDNVDVKVSSGLVLGEVHIPNDKKLSIPSSVTNNTKYRIGAFEKITKENRETVHAIQQYRGSSPYTIIFGTHFVNGLEQTKYLVDYLIYSPDTVTSYDYAITSYNSVKSNLNKTQEELISTKEELAKTKKELEYTKYELSQRSNPNLLINGDFQVWQRGESFDTSVKTNIYTADRWQLRNDKFANNVRVEKDGDCMKITTSQYNNSICGIYYLFEQEEVTKMVGKTYTLTVDVKSVTGKHNSVLQMKESPYTSFLVKENLKVGKNVVTGTIDNTNSLNLYIRAYSEGEIVINSVKLELGEYATPFVPRTYAEELALCQRYCYVMRWNNSKWMHGFGDAKGSDCGWVCFPLPTTMRSLPTLTGGATVNSNWIISTSKGKFSPNTITPRTFGAGGVVLDFTCSTALTTGEPVTMYYNSGNLGIFDAEIY